MLVKSLRDAHAEALLEVGRSDPRIWALDADLSTVSRSCEFAAEFPDRFVQCGIAEQNMVGVAAGLAMRGCVPFVHSLAVFLTGRAYDQIRQSVAFSGANVKLVGVHAGLSIGYDGATHQALEDIGMVAALPGMAIVVPSDAEEAWAAVHWAVRYEGPVYIRLALPAVPVFHPPGWSPSFIVPVVERDGGDVSILATGLMVHVALAAANALADDGVKARVVNVNGIKPTPEEWVAREAEEYGALVVAEEHSIYGGLSSIVSRIVAERYPVPVVPVAVRDVWGQSGDGLALLDLYGLGVKDIVAAAWLAMAKKGGR